jgi:hypothetical protein
VPYLKKNLGNYEDMKPLKIKKAIPKKGKLSIGLTTKPAHFWATQQSYILLEKKGFHC